MLAVSRGLDIVELGVLAGTTHQFFMGAVLDEPTAALDAETEHALFERYEAAAREGRITVLVSHRFSTVRMADLIVVLAGSCSSRGISPRPTVWRARNSKRMIR